MRERLAEEGLLAIQAGPTGPALHKSYFSAVVNTIASVFPTVRAGEAFVPAFGTTWGFALGSLGRDPLSMTPAEVNRRLAERVGPDLRFYDGITHAGMFALPRYLRLALESETRVITQDDPLYVV